jgi:hypothetical protein
MTEAKAMKRQDPVVAEPVMKDTPIMAMATIAAPTPQDQISHIEEKAARIE